jgi:hypothetical protein
VDRFFSTPAEILFSAAGSSINSAAFAYSSSGKPCRVAPKASAQRKQVMAITLTLMIKAASIDSPLNKSPLARQMLVY